MKKILTLIIFALTPMFSAAGSSSGKVQHIMVHAGSVLIFSVGTHNGKPSCSTAADNWAVSLATETGKSMYAMLLSAAAQRQTVSVMGENLCAAAGDRESPAYMWVDY